MQKNIKGRWDGDCYQENCYFNFSSTNQKQVEEEDTSSWIEEENNQVKMWKWADRKTVMKNVT